MVEEFDNFTTGNELWAVGVEDKEMSPILIYPTPTKDQLYIEGEYDYLRVINLLGKEVLHSTYQESINTASLKNGIYLLEITHIKNKYYQKMQVSR